MHRSIDFVSYYYEMNRVKLPKLADPLMRFLSEDLIMKTLDVFIYIYNFISVIVFIIYLFI